MIPPSSPTDWFAHDITPARESSAMTLIAVHCSPERVLVAVDGKVVNTDTARRSPPTVARAEKVRPVGDQSLVFGLIGIHEPIDDLGEWLGNHRPTSWRPYADAVREEVTRHNGDIRAWAKKAGVAPSEVQGIKVVVAGFLDAPGGLVVDEKGQRVWSTDSGTDFYGLFDGVARVALATAETVSPGYEPDTPEKLHVLMESLCSMLPELLLPVDVWEIRSGERPEKRF